ncbi:MAG: YncE family protein [Acidobacteriota bacterium]
MKRSCSLVTALLAMMLVLPALAQEQQGRGHGRLDAHHRMERLGQSQGAWTELPDARPSEVAEAVQTTHTYTLYVCAESDDIVEKVAFGPNGFIHLKSIPVGVWPTETEGPHGIVVSPDGKYWFVSIAHDQPGPFGSVHKYDTATDTWRGEVELGMFPATLSISPSIGLLYVVNFNLHGLPRPSTISVVEPESMSEVGRVGTGVMPHGSRMNREGTRQYSVNMMNDDLVEVDTYRMQVTRRLALSNAAPLQLGGDGSSAAPPKPVVKPTWATPTTPQGKLYVAGNGAATIFEVDVASWRISRKFENTGKGPYNIDVTADGKILVVTYKSDKSVGIWDLEKGVELARIDTLRPVPHGVVVSPDGSYAFVSIEGIGGEPGSVEAYDLKRLERVAHIDLAKQTGGIALWKVQ